MTNDTAPRRLHRAAAARSRSPSSRRGYNFGFVANMGRLLRAHPRIGRRFLGLFAEIMFAPEGALDRREREMIAAVAAAAQDCHY